MSGTTIPVPSQNDGRKVPIIEHDPLSQPRDIKVTIPCEKLDQLELKSGVNSVKIGYIQFLVLRILFVDLFVSIGDVGSDFTFGFQLLQEGATFIYGCISLAINWLPGIVASIYVVTMYRHMLSTKFAVLYAILVFLLYPIVPTVAYIALLWTRPSVTI